MEGGAAGGVPETAGGRNLERAARAGVLNAGTAESAAEGEKRPGMGTAGRNRQMKQVKNQEGKKRVAAYCRVSTEKEDQRNSLRSQKHYFTSYIGAHPDWELIRVYYDEGISGTQTGKRDGFNEMMDAALRGELDLILTKEVSRFARNTVDTLSCTRKLKAAGVNVIFTLDQIDTGDADGELRLTLMAGLAQEESRKTSERVKWGQRRSMEAGVVFGGDLLGYQVKNGKITVKESESWIVRLIFQKYTNEGKGAYTIARELREQGIKSRTEKDWSSTAVLRILRNEKYVGDLCQKKTFTPDFLTHRKQYNHGEEEIIYLENHHAGVIDRDLWERTRKELKRRGGMAKKGKKHSSRYWCSGKLFCGECGSRYVSRRKQRTDGSVSCSWRCQTAAREGAERRDGSGRKSGCSNGSIHECALTAAMNHCILSLLTDQKTLEGLLWIKLKKAEREEQAEKRAFRLEQEIRRIQEKKKRSVDLHLEGILSKEELKHQNIWYEEEIQVLRLQQQRLRREERDSDEAEERLKTILRFEQPEPQVYGEILDRMVIYKENRVEIWLRSVPFGFQLKLCTHGKKYIRAEILERSLIEKTETVHSLDEGKDTT